MLRRISDLDPQTAALKAARKRKGWSQNRLAAALEQAASTFDQVRDLPPGGRPTLVQYISYFENGKRNVPARLQAIFCEALQSTSEELGFDNSASTFGVTKLPDLPAAHLAAEGPVVLSSLGLILESNIQAHARIGPAYLIPAVQSQLPVIEQICRMTRRSDHEQALRLGSQFAEFCGWLFHDAGDFESAMYWTDRALEYAAELDDRRVISYVLMRKSNIATDAGQAGHGLGLANAALNQGQLLTPRLRAVALRQRANAHALLAQAADFARDTDDALVQALDGVSQEEVDHAPYCTPSYVEMEAGACWLKLGAAPAAIPVFEDSRAQWTAPDQVRDLALCLARLATAYAKIGEPESACAVAKEVITIADGLGSARLLSQIADLRSSLASWRKSSDVADLLYRLESFRDPGAQA